MALFIIPTYGTSVDSQQVNELRKHGVYTPMGYYAAMNHIVMSLTGKYDPPLFIICQSMER